MKTLRTHRTRARSLAVVASITSALASLLTLAPPAHALNYFVGCADTAALTAAIADAQTNGVDDNIVLAKKCTYELTSPWLATDNGLPVIDEPSTITTIYGYGSEIARSKDAPNFRHLEVATGATLVLRDITLTGGKIGAFNTGPHQAGSILIDDGGALVTEKLTVKYNRILVTDAAVTASAGGIFNDGGSLTLNLSTVKGNEIEAFGVTAFSAGGGIATRTGATTSLKKTVVKDNHVEALGPEAGSALGGGIAALDPADTLILDRSSVTDNEAEIVSGATAAAVGGGLFLAGTTSIRQSEVSENEAESESAATSEAMGGGIFNTGHLEMDTGPDDEGSEVIENRASCPDSACVAEGGGYAGQGVPGDPATAVFVLTDFRDNVASAYKGVALGGGLYVDEGTADLIESKVKYNKASGKLAKGGGIFASSTGTVTLEASSVKKNKPGDCYRVFGC